MAVDKFEVGKWYLYIGPKNKLVFELQHIADGKPRQCLKAQGERGVIFSDMWNDRPLNGGLWKFNRNDFAEVKAPSQPKPKNKYRSFTKDDIGKTFTVRQWDDMTSEFDEHSENAIRFDTSLFIFAESMKSYCGKKIIVSSIIDDKINSVRCKDNNGLAINMTVWIPQMFEECIIKESKVGDTAGITREGLKIMTASALKESIEKDMKAAFSYYFSTPSVSQPNWIDRLYNRSMPSTVKGFLGLIEEMNNVDHKSSFGYLEKDTGWQKEIYDFMSGSKQDKTKFNTDLIKTEKLNFRMDR